MSSDTITLRYIPTGKTEQRLSPTVPRVGDVLRRDGDGWLVVDVRTDRAGATTVTLKALDDGDAAAA